MIKASLGKLEINFDPVALEDAVQLKTLPFHHGDPFDRMLIAQSLAQKTRIMSDRRFAAYDCALI